jgi:two-component system, LytTR family, sensor histidine kinase AlgZ
MKIIRTSKAQRVVFWVGWAFFGLVLAATLRSSGQLSRTHAFALAAVLSGIAQVIAITASFTSRTLPLSRTPVWRLVLTHVIASDLLTLFWVKIGVIAARQFDALAGWAGIYNDYSAKVPIFYVMGSFFYLLSVAVQYLLIAQKSSQEAQERAVESTVRAREAELAALKAQINPHFLYNSLNSISALTSIDPARARAMCVSLADFLRLTLGMGEKAVIPLREEVGLLDKYCAIEKVRFGDRLTVEEQIEEEAKDCLLPPLLLQPLFENAVIHGIAQMAEGGWIRLQAARHGDRLSLIVENSWDAEAGSSRKNGVGLKNVQRRLEARYGNQAQLQATAEDEVFRVSLSFPAETEARNDPQLEVTSRPVAGKAR